MEKGKLGSGPVRSPATSVCAENERAPSATRREAKTFLHKTAWVQNRCAAPEIPVAVGGAKPAARDHTANISAVCRRNAAVAPRGFIDGERFLPPAAIPAGSGLSKQEPQCAPQRTAEGARDRGCGCAPSAAASHHRAPMRACWCATSVG